MRTILPLSVLYTEKEHVMEATGFWIAFAGWLLLILSSISINMDVATSWIERKLRVPWYIQILATPLAVIMMMVGWHLWCLGNRGRYPGYPLDIL